MFGRLLIYSRSVRRFNSTQLLLLWFSVIVPLDIYYRLHLDFGCVRRIFSLPATLCWKQSRFIKGQSSQASELVNDV